MAAREISTSREGAIRGRKSSLTRGEWGDIMITLRDVKKRYKVNKAATAEFVAAAESGADAKREAARSGSTTGAAASRDVHQHQQQAGRARWGSAGQRAYPPHHSAAQEDWTATMTTSGSWVPPSMTSAPYPSANTARHGVAAATLAVGVRATALRTGPEAMPTADWDPRTT